MPRCNIKIESFTPDKEQLKAYALAFKEAIPTWQNYLGEPIFMSQMGFDEDAEELREAISNATPSKCISLLKKFDIFPEKLYRFSSQPVGLTESLPIYTGIRQISLEGHGSILAEAFFGAEIHLLDSAGRLLSIYNPEFSPKFGLGQLYLIDCNSLYDSQVKGRMDDPTAMEIVGYAPENLTRSFTFNSQYGKEYRVENQGKTEKIIIGTGDSITVSDLKILGKYCLLRKSDADDADDLWFSSSAETWLSSDFYHVGQEWKNIPDFTIQYNTFPFLNERDQWVMHANNSEPEERREFFAERCHENSFIQQQLAKDPCSFQFMPLEIRGEKSWVEAFCLKNPVNFLFVDTPMRNDRELAIKLIRSADKYEDSIYPYLPELLRKDIDLLTVMKEVGRLFHLSNPKDLGEPKIKDIRDFVYNNQSRISEILELFPNVLHFAPEELLNDRQLLLHALPADNELVSILSESLRDDADIILAASDKYFASLQFASPRLREDPIFVMQMIDRCGENISFAADWMRADRKFVLAAAHTGSRIFDNVPEHFRDDEEIMLEIVKNNSYALEKASERLRLDKSFNIKALENGAYYRHNIHESLLDDRDIVLKAMEKHPHEFKHIPERFKADREIVLTVVAKKGGYGKYIKDCPLEMRDDPDIIKATVMDSDFNIMYASPRLLADRYFLAEIINENPSAFLKIPEQMQSDPGLSELAKRRKEELNKSNLKEPINDEDDLPF